MASDMAFEKASSSGGREGSTRGVNSALGRLSRAPAITDMSRRSSAGVVVTSSAADKYLGYSATGTRKHDMEELPKFIIHPLDAKYRIWWYITVAVSGITGFLQPYFTAFSTPGFYPYGSSTAIVVYVCLAIIVTDMFMNFRVARYTDGHLVTAPKQLAKLYIKDFFFIDLLSVLPFDEIALAIAGLNGPDYVKNEQLAYYLALLRLFGMLRLYRLGFFFSWLTYNLGTPLLVVATLRNILLTFLVANFEACTFYYIALQEGFSSESWVGASWFAGNTNKVQLYIYSLYWAATTIATVGYGDIHAYTPVEAGIALVFMIANLFVFAYIIGSITLLIVKGDERVGEYRQQMQNLQAYASLNSLPTDLKESMLSHLKLHFNNEQRSDEQVLRAYPSMLRRRVLRFLYLEELHAAELFMGARQRFMDAVLSAARIELYLPQVEILSEGDHVSELYVLMSGSARSFRTGTQGGKDLALDRERSVRAGRTLELQPGTCFGAVAFFTGTEQMETVRTHTVARVLTITRTDYDSIAERYPDSARAVLHNLQSMAEEMAMEQFPNSLSGAQQFSAAVGNSSVSAYQFGPRPSMSAPQQAGQRGPGAAAGQPAVALLPLTRLQERAVGNVVRVKAIVKQFVIKHDETRLMEFLGAASRGNTGRVREMLEQGFDVNSSDYDGRTALMLASVKGYAETALLLLVAGANPNAKDSFDGTAMWEACKHGHDKVVDLLQQYGGTLERSGVEEAALLCTCVFDGELRLLRRLLHAGAHVDAGDYDQRTALHISAAEGNLPAVQLLVKEGGADPGVQDRWGNTPLAEAQRVKAVQVQAFLEQHLAAAPPSP